MWRFSPAFSWVLEGRLVGESCLSCLSASQRGAPLISKYAARRKNRVAPGAENIGDGVGWARGTVYPAKSWAPRGRAHEYRAKHIAKAGCPSVSPSVCDVEVSWSYRLEFCENNFTAD